MQLLEEMQSLETQQQAHRTTLEQRGYRDELKTKQLRARAEQAKKQKVSLKNLSKVDAKKVEKEEKDLMASLQKKETEELEQQLAKQKGEEDEALKAAHKYRVEDTRKEHESRMLKVIADHEEERKHRENLKATMTDLIEKQKKEQFEKTKQQQDALKQALEDHFKVVKEGLIAFLAEQSKIVEQQRQIQTDVQKRHKSSEEELQKLAKAHKEDADDVAKKQEGLTQGWEKQRAVEKEKLDAKFVLDMKHLEEEQKKDPLAELDSMANSPRFDKNTSKSSLRKSDKDKKDEKKGTSRGDSKTLIPEKS